MLKSTRACSRWLILALALSAAACAKDDDDDGACPGLDEGCSIALAHCRRQIFAATACVRGQRGATLPEVRTITREEYAAELRAEAAPDDDFDTRVWGTGLGLFGLVPRAQSLQESDVAQRVASVAAFYRRDAKNVTVISDTGMERSRAVLTLSHEFVHALQDQREGLQAFYDAHAKSSDASLALKCVTEGEAVLLSNLTSLHFRGLAPNEVDWDGYFQNWLERALSDVGEAEAPLLASRSLVYPLGGAGLWQAFERAGVGEIQRFYAEPAHTLQSWADPVDGVREPAALDCAAPPAPAGLSLKYFDRQGYAGLLSLYVGLGQGVRDDDARRWRSDWYALYSDPGQSSEAVAVAWRLRLASDDDAAQLAELVAGSELAIEAHVAGPEVLLIAANDAELLSGWSDRTACGSPEKARSATLRPPPLRWLSDPHTF